MLYPTEYRRIKNSGFGYQYDIRFPLPASSADERGIFIWEFPRLSEAPAFYVCAKGPGTSNRLSIKNYSVPSGQEIKVRCFVFPPAYDNYYFNFLVCFQRISRKLIALVPIGDSIPFEAASSEDEGVLCKGFNSVIAIRRYVNHAQNW